MSHVQVSLPELPPADISPYDYDGENGPVEYGWYERSMRAYATAAVLKERQELLHIMAFGPDVLKGSGDRDGDDLLAFVAKNVAAIRKG